jgi:hypothetical protein
MVEALRPIYERTVEILRADERVVAAVMYGSVGTDREDEFADVDPFFLVRAADFEAMDRDLPEVFRQAGVEPVLWWPERVNGPTLRNYAVLFEVEGELLQYDMTIVAVGEGDTTPVRAEQVIFDKTGVLKVVDDPGGPAYSPEKLRWTVEMYWLYIYIHAKYLKRGDRFKIIAAQQELMNVHLEVLRALHPEAPPDWWPITAKRVCKGDDEEACLGYLRGLDKAAVIAALPAEMDRFARDARKACAKWDVEYPDDFEARARKHIAGALHGDE